MPKRPAPLAEPADPAPVRFAWLPLDQLRDLPNNPVRQHRVGALVASMQAHGFGAPITRNTRTRHTLAGNGRTKALRKMHADGLEPPEGIRVDPGDRWLVPAYLGEWPADREHRVAVALNGGPKRNMLADLDDNAVAAILAATAEAPTEAEDLGLTATQAEQFLIDSETAPPEPQIDLDGLETCQPQQSDNATLQLALPRPLFARAVEALKSTTAADLIRPGIEAAEAAAKKQPAKKKATKKKATKKKATKKKASRKKAR